MEFNNSAPMPDESLKVYTTGDYKKEKDAAIAFDSYFTNCGGLNFFGLYPEVTGYYLQPMPGRRVKDTCRIDRLLVPKKTAIDAGWTDGIVGVEIKKSGEKLGPVFNQVADYLRAAYTLDQYADVIVRQIFIWPTERIGGFVESILMANRIGPLFYDTIQRRLVFSVGGVHNIVLKNDESIFKPITVGVRSGSR